MVPNTPNTTQLHHWTILMMIRKVVFGNAAVFGTKPYINIWVAEAKGTTDVS